MQKEDKMIKWIFIIVIVVAALNLNGCADVADAEDSLTTTSTETQNEARTNLASDDENMDCNNHDMEPCHLYNRQRVFI